MFEKQIVIDGKGHLLGRLAAVVAKHLLNGQRIVVVRAEAIEVSGPLFRNVTKYRQFRHFRSNTNPWRGGPWHYKAPAKMFWRSLRGMTPHKTARGAAALARLRVFEGCPHPYSHMKKSVIPNTMRIVRLKSMRKFTTLGELSDAIGWNRKKLIETLETKRKDRASLFFKNKVKVMNAVEKQAMNLPEVKKLQKQLEQYGY